MIYDFILDGTQDNAMRVERLHEVMIRDAQQAKKIGTQYNASMVIWGYYDALRIQPYVAFVGQRTLMGDAIQISTPTPIAFFFHQETPTKAAYLALYSIGLTHIEINSATELYQAISFFDAALNITQGWEAFVWRANCYAWLGDHETALKDYTQALTLNPNDKSGYFNRGLTYYYIGKHEEAIADYTQAIELDPNYALAYANRGTAYKRLWQNGEPTREKAIADFERVLTLIDDPVWREDTENDLKALRGE